MEIRVKIITKLGGTGKIKAFARAWLGSIMIDSIKIGQDGQDLFVLMPSEKSSNGKYYSIVKIEDVALESKFVGAVLQAYLETLDYEEVK